MWSQNSNALKTKQQETTVYSCCTAACNCRRCCGHLTKRLKFCNQLGNLMISRVWIFYKLDTYKSYRNGFAWSQFLTKCNTEYCHYFQCCIKVINTNDLQHICMLVVYTCMKNIVALITVIRRMSFGASTRVNYKSYAIVSHLQL